MLHAYAADFDPSDIDALGRFSGDSEEVRVRSDAHLSMLNAAVSDAGVGLALADSGSEWLTLDRNQVEPFAEADPYGVDIAIPYSDSQEVAHDMIDRAFRLLRALEGQGLKPYDDELGRRLNLETDLGTVTTEYGRGVEHERETRLLLTEVCTAGPGFRKVVEEEVAYWAPLYLAHLVMAEVTRNANQIMERGGTEGEAEVARLLAVLERSYDAGSYGADDVIGASFLENITPKADYTRLWAIIEHYPKLNASLQS